MPIFCESPVRGPSGCFRLLAASLWKAFPTPPLSELVAFPKGNMDGKEPELRLPPQTGHDDSHIPTLQFRLCPERAGAQLPPLPSPPHARPDHQGGLSSIKVVIPSKRGSSRGFRSNKNMSQSLSPPGSLSLGSGIMAALGKSQVALCCDGDHKTGALAPLEF